MDPIGWTIGGGIAALAFLAPPVVAVGILCWSIIRRRTKRTIVVSVVAAILAILILILEVWREAETPSLFEAVFGFMLGFGYLLIVLAAIVTIALHLVRLWRVHLGGNHDGPV